MKKKTRATLGQVYAKSATPAAQARFEKLFRRILEPRPWIREFVRRNGRLPYRDEVESYFFVVRKMIECRKSLREVAGVQK